MDCERAEQLENMISQQPPEEAPQDSDHIIQQLSPASSGSYESSSIISASSESGFDEGHVAPEISSHPEVLHAASTTVTEERHHTRPCWLRGFHNSKLIYLKTTISNGDCARSRIIPPLDWSKELIGEASSFIARVEEPRDDGSFPEFEAEVKIYPHAQCYYVGGFRKLIAHLVVKAGDCLKMDATGLESVTPEGERLPVVLFSVTRKADNPDAKLLGIRAVRGTKKKTTRLVDIVPRRRKSDRSDVCAKKKKEQDVDESEEEELSEDEEQDDDDDDDAVSVGIKEEKHNRMYQWCRGLDGLNTVYLKVTMSPNNVEVKEIRPPQNWWQDLVQTDGGSFIAHAAKDDKYGGGFATYNLEWHKYNKEQGYYHPTGPGMKQLLSQLKVEAGDCIKMELIDSSGKKPVVLFSLIKRKDNPSAETILKKCLERGAGKPRAPRKESGGQKQVRTKTRQPSPPPPKRRKQKGKSIKKVELGLKRKPTSPNVKEEPQAKKKKQRRRQGNEAANTTVSPHPTRPPPSSKSRSRQPSLQQQQEEEEEAPIKNHPDKVPAVLLSRKLLRNDDDKVVGAKCSVYFEPGSRSLAEISAAISRFGIDCGDTGVVVDDYEVLPAENLVNATLKMSASSHGGGDGVATAALSRAAEAFVDAL